MSSFEEVISVCDSDNSTESINYNDLTAEEKEEIDEAKKNFEKDKYTIRKKIPLKNKNNYSNNSKKDRTHYTKKIIMYSTRPTARACIRDPVYGTYSSDKVGTKAEYNYFKVRMPDIPTEDRTPLTLYYDSPEGYEKHQYTRVSTDIKNAWHDRRTKNNAYSIPRFDAPKFIEIK
jgi:hypothetical protein